MASSGSVDFTVTRDEIIKGALRAARIVGKDQTVTPTEITTGAEALNMLVKQWQGKSDFAPGLKVWSRKTAYLFLQFGQSVYNLGPSGDNWTSTYRTTTLASSKGVGATAITLSDNISTSTADAFGIVLDSGFIGWTTISVGNSGTSQTLSANQAGVASAGAVVFTYTSLARRPLELLTAVLRDIDDKDTPLGWMTLAQSEALPDKTADGTPSRVLYESMLTNGRLTLDCEPSEVTKVIRIVFLGALEDFDALNDTPDYPQEWFRPLKFQLAVDLWPEYKDGDPPKSLLMLAESSLAIAQNANPETSEAFFEPDR